MLKRRQVLQLSSTAALLPAFTFASGSKEAPALALNTRAIPSSGELIPGIGMGTARTFDTDNSQASLENLSAVMRAFADGGGTVVDTSPMYGKAEERVGDVLQRLSPRPPVFAATKVWTEGKEAGIAQMQRSAARMNVDRFDLIAVHNLKDWKTQLETLKQWKEEGKVRYIGITTSHARNHDEFVHVMKTQPLDFIQVSYNLQDRIPDQRIFPLAKDKGIAVMVNRPFQRGKLFDMVRGQEVPAYAHEFNCYTWGQFFLKFVLANEAVTCILPATSNPAHMADNMQANFGRTPTDRERVKMVTDVLPGF